MSHVTMFVPEEVTIISDDGITEIGVAARSGLLYFVARPKGSTKRFHGSPSLMSVPVDQSVLNYHVEALAAQIAADAEDAAHAAEVAAAASTDQDNGGTVL